VQSFCNVGNRRRSPNTRKTIMTSSNSDHEHVYPQATRAFAEQRTRLAPGPAAAFKAFSQSVFAEGALPVKTKQLIAVAAAHVTQCPYCIRGHTGAALRAGATPEEIMEAIWVAAEMRAGAASSHSVIALDVIGSAAPARDNSTGGTVGAPAA
jgi:AhpD family alkylhydroperoxidase